MVVGVVDVAAIIGRTWSKVERSSCSFERAEEMRLTSCTLILIPSCERRRRGERSSRAKPDVIGSSLLIETMNMLRRLDAGISR